MYVHQLDDSLNLFCSQFIVNLVQLLIYFFLLLI